MTDDKTAPWSKPAHRKKGRRRSAVSDRWFDSQLNRLYGDVVEEPLPDDLLSLIEKLKAPRPDKK